ncbi:MAG: hypothetical protein C4530_22410 [Desulfobacteraceae bacterium]|nr:MAG: hypothetical protein C4530_22410 [Desulfobacteraceae bacterium]
MILNPAIIALIGGGILVCAFAVYAAANGILILRHWDLASGSDRQLGLERKTYLISTIFSYLLAFEFFGLFLFVYTTDHIHDLFVGAMCAAGTLKVNDYGYVTLVVKMAAFASCGIWMIVNHTDSKGYDYPLIRSKYKFLLPITGILLLENFLQYRYFTGLRADVITSCCGVLFSVDAENVAGGMAALPAYGTQISFFLSIALSMRTGAHFLLTGRGVKLFSLLVSGTMILSLVAVVSFISVYYYELPTHHCPFCLLQKEYHYIGYPLYLTIFLGGIAGAGSGILQRVNGAASLKEAIPSIQRRLCVVSMTAFAGLAVIALYPMIFSDFILE